MYIDKVSYNKAQRIPYNPNRACGYMPRPLGRLDIRAAIIHTTNGRKGTTLHQEAEYITTSRNISAHYLIGKQGQIIQFLDPSLYIAYHAGCVKSTVFSNVFAIGIEMHNTPSEGHCTSAQLESLDELVRYLISKYDIQERYIETHRGVAVFCSGKNKGKLGRKIDPSGFPNNEFYAWRSTLYTKVSITKYKVIAREVNIRSSPQINPKNIVGTLSYGDTFTSIALLHDELGQVIKGVNTWAHVTWGIHNGIKVDGLGFVHVSNLTIVE